MGSYVPTTAAEREQMLAQVGVKSLNDLYAAVPQEMFLHDGLNLPEGLSELEVREKVTDLAEKNKVFKTVLRGAGSYRHFIPAVVKSITSREELVTCYTPYQAEISQGALQGIFEFQTMLCELTGMDVSNASHYDGATAAAETIPMCKDRKRSKVYVSAAAHPQVIQVMQTYCFASNTELLLVPAKDGRTDMEALKAALGADAAMLYVQQPNYFGQIEDAKALGELTHAAGAKFVMGVNPIACALLPTPRECGADIAVGDGQPLGLDIAFGGPYLGFMATTSALTRKLPGRIVGETHDVEGQRGYVLTLSARVCVSKAHYFAKKLEEAGCKLKYQGEFFHEFVTECACPNCQKKILDALAAQDILGGYPVEGGILWCVTELATKETLDRAAAIVKEAL